MDDAAPRRSPTHVGIDRLRGLPPVRALEVPPRSVVKGLAMAVAAGLLAAGAYRAGQMQLPVFGLSSEEQAIGFVQIGNEIPGQPFEIAVDRVVLDVTHRPDPPGTPVCAAPETSAEGFESATFPPAALVKAGGGGHAVVQPKLASEGKYAVLLTSQPGKDSFAYVRWQTCDVADLDVSADFRVSAEGSPGGNQPLFRLFAPDGTRLISLYRQNAESDRVFIEYRGGFQQTTAHVPLKKWTTIELRISSPDGVLRRVDILQDGVLVFHAAA